MTPTELTDNRTTNDSIADPLIRICQYFRTQFEDRRIVPIGQQANSVMDYLRRVGSGGGAGGDDQAEIGIAGLDSLDAPGENVEVFAETQASAGCAILSTRELAASASAEAFEQSCRNSLAGRTAAFYSQSRAFPHRLREGLESDALRWVVAVGHLSELAWPSLGITMPTVDNSVAVADAVKSMLAVYPGEIRFAIVANGTDSRHLAGLRRLRDEHADCIDLLEQDANLGYGPGSNVGLAHLRSAGAFELFGVTNDDVIPALDCLCEMVCAIQELGSLGYKPGMIGPMSNRISGAQAVELGSYESIEEMWSMAAERQVEFGSSAVQAVQVRGLFLLITSDCLQSIGGFDPRFGLGNFEDDDLNLRAKLAGYTLWIAQGAFLHHHGSSTFKQLQIDYEANIRRNAETFMQKWNLDRLEAWPEVETAPEETPLYLPLLPSTDASLGYPITINGERVDLVAQASDVEFAAWVMSALRGRPRHDRRSVIDVIENRAA